MGRTHVELTSREMALLIVLCQRWHVSRHYAEEEYHHLEQLGLSTGVGWRARITEKGLEAAKTISVSKSVWIPT